MSQLESLLSITRMQSERQLVLLQQKKRFIDQLERQRQELIEYSLSYQKGAVGTDGNLATLLVHRQRFITQLSTQIDELTQRISSLSEDADTCAAQWHQLDARQKAIESMHAKKVSKYTFEREKREQQTNDELARSSRKSGFDSDKSRVIENA